MLAQHTIRGKIIDDQKQSLPFVNIILYTVNNESNPKGTVSNNSGDYILENITSKKYRIEISMLGFETYKIKEMFKKVLYSFQYYFKRRKSNFK